MSLLRSALNHRAFHDNPKDKNAQLFKKHDDSATVHSTATKNSVASSITSFYSTLTGGSKVPKRRRSPFSTLGQAEFSAGSPPAYNLPAGIEVAPLTRAPLATHVATLKDKEDRPRVSLLLYNYATEESGLGQPFYTSNNVISGEVRLVLTKAEEIKSIDVWVGSQAGSSVFPIEPHALKMHANLWTPERGDPANLPAGDPALFSGSFQPGTYEFTFTFEPLPSDIKVRQDMKAFGARNNTSIPLPPSFDMSMPLWYGSIKYEIGVDIIHGKLGIDEHLTTPFKYEPRFRAVPRADPLPPFPLLTSRSEWPYERESVGGWSITPFGGRGHWNLTTMIQVEGLLGIRDPSVAHPGDELEVVLLLWSDHPEALAEIAKPDCVELSFLRTFILGADALSPTHRARKNRQVWPKRQVDGIAWSDSEGDHGRTGVAPHRDDSHSVPILHAGDPAKNEGELSPTPSEEDLRTFPGQADAGHIIEIQGSVPVAVSEGEVSPSFRYQNIAIEYLVHVLICHPKYNHISPSAPGIEGEAPIWVVTGPRAGTETSTPANAEKKFYGESIVPLSQGSFRAPKVVGKQTDKLRPNWDDTLVGQGYRSYNL